MKLILSYISLVTILSTGFWSCKKFLDKKADTGQVVPTSVSDLQALLDNSDIMNRNITPIFEESSADDYFLVNEDYNSFSTQDQNAYIWHPYDNVLFPNDWSYCYAPVYNANYCLEQIDKVSQESSDIAAWYNVKGSALFYRSYCFSHLAWAFAKAYDQNTENSDQGIALRLSSDFNQASTRANVKDTYERIISDAKEASEYLADVPAHAFRPSRPAAYGLLARVYLSMRQYDSAFTYADRCLKINSQLMNYNGDPDITGSLTGSNSPFKQFNKETIFYSTMSNTYATSGAFYACIDTLLFQSYATNDLRRSAFFRTKTGYPTYRRFKGSYAASTTFLFTGIATDEMYLVRAECFARKGDKTSALADLNTLLAKRYNATFIPVTAADADEALVKILSERRKELLMRDLRFIDIKRLNKEGANLTQKRIINGQTFTISPNDNRYALPLPRDIVTQSSMPQNEY